MKKIFLLAAILVTFTLTVYADNKQDALNFYNSYINAANNYSDSVTGMYALNAKIIRQVIKPDGSTQNVYTNTDTYIKQMKIGQAGAKLRQYKNNYTNITVTPMSDTKFKISSIRHPSCDNDSLKTYAVVQKQPNGKWLIVEELMQTRQKIFLKYAK